ncbi:MULTISPECIES: aldehyde dehydrogenase family protein [Marivita]|jgi:aldehyde dehydrogenase (NAD+)|uniref:Aldehyde dehydrogenase family protein n=1 Tax=Marivita cryptomonadis TaxID=505252 RepID=A0A9Q2NP99_9RHOB|nr:MULTISPECIES: aldehyde dehydrogenase family protein [Marivita]MCR9168482.1 aldehyde dehydrogenase family protein [Paracoccaceae bacterium]MBM2320099.1 aldehyde dehydrogenase family protein [Marivita cryptomonadis]MBM2329678.1 aldehyde dehydrogenase family protein [Marivita cryptomonadis]MBM2339266.1 aldehyde dehydrogenase family protein [Marivita cryptomonadis]MBM2343924.1 aldehyde dehydrogenase family protein [Marivita cryptomonadis]
MQLETCNFIAGDWRDGPTRMENHNPSDLSETIGHFAQADTLQLAQAFAAAREAQAVWGATGPQKRHDVLMAIGTELMARAEEIGTLIAREEGKPAAEGKGEVYRAGQFFTYFAAEALRQLGQTADSVRDGIEIDVRREPVGVVAIISPWNFPVATPAWKIAPALAFGNAVIWKPANQTPASAVALTQIIAKQDLPKELFNLVMGAGREIGQALAESADVDAISFTGSVPVGRGIAAAAIPNMTKLQMEMGSKNPMVIMDDCDIDLAVAHATNAAFGGTGQKCTAASRLIVHERIHDEFVDKLAAAAQALRVGHALEDGTQIGPVVSAEQLASNLAYIKTGTAEGAELVCGGTRLERPTEGYFMAPTVFAGTRNDMRINREEMFAPITCVIKAYSYDEALHLANDTEFGLTAGIMTRDLARATHFRRNARAGCVMINLPTAGTDYHVPFGGRGASSYGPREQGRFAEEFYTTVKTAYSYAGAPA